MLEQLIVSAVVGVLATLSLTRYRTLNQSYDRHRKPVSSDMSFRRLYRPLLITVAVTAIAASWSDAPILLKVHDSRALRLLGSGLALAGIFAFEASIRALGTQYSPCFDVRVPTIRVRSGPYRWIAHPIYVSNLATLAGVFVASGCLWVLAAGIVVGLYYVRSARKERRVLDSLTEPACRG
jgi:protein-S-isoprenylcysteine O-methyltransferase Ste14